MNNNPFGCVPPKGTFAGELYNMAGLVHGMGITPAQLLEQNIGDYRRQKFSRSTNEEEEIRKLIAGAKKMVEEMGDNFEFPPKLGRYWAIKRNKTWMTPSEEVFTTLRKMYDQGKGYKNSDIRYSAEKAVPELHQIYADQWDQRAVLTAKKVKSVFSSWAREEKDAADNQPKGSVRVDEDADDVDETKDSEAIDEELEPQWIEDLGLPNGMVVYSSLMSSRGLSIQFIH
mmetsp:Transcript_10779/g.27280  ORF Transcript_10779/g.27280 Transcript_10779/m.27280 type:complete len:229 (+) Transcript_10779:1695-2381(+)